MLQRPSSWSLIGANLIPIVGATFWGWGVFDVVFLYWLENVIIGVGNVARMVACQPVEGAFGQLAGPGSAGSNRSGRALAFANGLLPLSVLKIFMVPFFIVHYGGFCTGHVIFIFAIFGSAALAGDGASPQILVASVLGAPMIFAAVSLMASHTYSFFQNFILGGEYRRTSPMMLMGRPYGRVVVLHVAIIVGGGVVMKLGDQLPFLLLLIVLKTGLDLKLHHKEREKLGSA